MRHPLALGRVDDADRDLDDPQLGGDGAQDDLGLERVAVVATAEPERAGDRIAAEAALRVGEGAAREEREEEVGDAVRDLVLARRAGSDEIANPEERAPSGSGSTDEEAQRLVGRMLAVGVDGDGDVEALLERGAEAGAERRAFAAVPRVTEDDARRRAARSGRCGRSTRRR